MADDWQVGDLALCVGGDDNFEWQDDGPKPGSISTVRRTAIDPSDGDLFLGFQEWPAHLVFHACEFRKIRPLAWDEHAEFIAELAQDAKRPVPA